MICGERDLLTRSKLLSSIPNINLFLWSWKRSRESFEKFAFRFLRPSNFLAATGYSPLTALAKEGQGLQSCPSWGRERQIPSANSSPAVWPPLFARAQIGLSLPRTWEPLGKLDSPERHSNKVLVLLVFFLFVLGFFYLFVCFVFQFFFYCCWFWFGLDFAAVVICFGFGLFVLVFGVCFVLFYSVGVSWMLDKRSTADLWT